MSIELPTSGRLAGIDFGTVRIGVAVSDAQQVIASPYDVLQRSHLQREAAYFQELVRNENIVGFVVGLPTHMSGDESQKSAEAREFGVWLGECTRLPVVYHDERLTTALARELLRESQLSARARKAKLDKMAAQIILRSYLESHRTSEENRPLDDRF